MTFWNKIELVTKGVPIVTTYKLSVLEEEFKEFSKSQFDDEDDINPFSKGSKKFLGRFHGYDRREFFVKIKGSFFKRVSSSNSIWIHGEIQEGKENPLILNIAYHRTKFARLGQWIVRISLLLMLLLVAFGTYKDHDFLGFLAAAGTLLFFYVVITLIAVTQTSGQVQYFERHFIMMVNGE